MTDVDDYSDMISEVMSAEFIKFYNLQDILLNSNKMYYILRFVEFDNFRKISEQYIKEFKYLYDHEDEYNDVLEVFRDFIVEKLSDIACDIAQESIYQKVSDKFDDYVDEFDSSEENDLELIIRNEVSDNILDYIDSEIGPFNKDLQLESKLFDLDRILSNIDIEDVIESVNQERKDDYDDDERSSDWRSEYDEISYMFER